jgi:predicted GNAT family N-acyltransferase
MDLFSRRVYTLTMDLRQSAPTVQKSAEVARDRMGCGVKFAIATGEKRSSALALQNLVYSEALGHLPADGLDADAVFLVAESSAHEVVASIRLVGPAHRPFDFETQVDLRRLVEPGARAALVGRLCVVREFRPARKSIPLQRGLLHFMVKAADQNSITDLFLYTYESLVRFYRVALFENTGLFFRHSDWGFVRLMRLRVSHALSKLESSNELDAVTGK